MLPLSNSKPLAAARSARRRSMSVVQRLGRLTAAAHVHGLGGSSMLQAVTGRGYAPARGASARKCYGSASDAYTQGSAPAPRVVVLGGGFGGLYAAVRLDQLMWPRNTKPQVVLVDQNEKFVFKPLLYELLNGTATEEEVAPGFSQLLAPYPVRFVQAQVTSVDPADPGSAQQQQQQPAQGEAAAPAAAGASGDDDGAAGHVALSDGSRLPYDYLVVALGSQPDSRGVEGVTEWSVPFNSYEDAVRVRGTLDLLSDSGAGGSVVVVGGGYAGVELACVMAERLRGSGGVTVRLITPGSDVLEGSPLGQQEAARKVLSDLGVEVMPGTRVQQLLPPQDGATAIPTACTMRLQHQQPSSSSSSSSSSGEGASDTLAADLVVWTAGSAPTLRRARSGFPFPINEKGAIMTEPTLAVQGMPGVFALGDIAAAAALKPATGSDSAATPSTAGFQATAQVAFQQADYVAWNVWASINGRPLLPFRYQHLGSMMALGQLNAAVALPIPLPPPLTSSLSSSPLGPLLSAVGVKLSSQDPDSGVTLEGPLAAVLRRAAYLYRQPTNEQRISVATGWLRRGIEVATALVGSGAGAAGRGGSSGQ